jgi:hypothetical protein
MDDQQLTMEEYMQRIIQGGKDKPPLHEIVDSPKHYMLRGDLEVRDVLSMLVEKIQTDARNTPSDPLFESDYVQMMQYLMRFMDKNGVEDLCKAAWYLDKLIQAYD